MKPQEATRLTTQDLRGLQPCCDPTRYFSEEWEGTLQDILNDTRIPVEDRLWVFCKAAPDDTQNEFARWCALQVTDKWNAPDVVREYLETGNEELRETAAQTAWAAARSAAADAARSAWAAWAAAAADAARSAWAAAADAAWDAQLTKAIELVNEEG